MLYAEKLGRPVLADGVDGGLHYLKYYAMSHDERVLEGSIGNLNWQFFRTSIAIFS